MNTEKVQQLFAGKLKVINVGVEHFADSLRGQGVEVEHVQFRPVADGDQEMQALLEKMGY